jgi:beta-lactam-binding protein with PASTA domain
VEVPKLVGMTTRAATNVLADQGLHWRITHKTTSRSALGSVISQSKPAGGDVRPGATITLVVAKARFHDLGPGFYDTRNNADRTKRNHVRQLQALGYKVTLKPATT